MKTKIGIIILCIVMLSSNLVYAEESNEDIIAEIEINTEESSSVEIIDLGTPGYLTLEVEEDCFKLGWKNPPHVFNYNNVEYQIDFKEGRGEWISSHRELSSRELPFVVAGRSYEIIDAAEEGLIDSSIDLENTSYSFRIRYKYTYDENGQSNTVYGDFSSPALLGLQPQYQNASQWAFVELDKAAEYGMIPESVRQDMKQEITRKEFSEIVVKLYELQAGETINYEGQFFIDTSEPDVLKAAKLGIANGVGEGRFAPDAPVTRQEIAVMLKRTLALLYPDMDFSYGKDTLPSIESNIAEWAVYEINFMKEQGILVGDSNGLINPTGHTTREQAVILALRTYEKFK